MKLVKTYTGRRVKPEERTVSEVIVQVDGRPLHHYSYHSPDGFNWGYGGSGPADLSLAILANHFNERPVRNGRVSRSSECRCIALHQDFKFDFVSKWGDAWKVTSDEIEAWAAKHESRSVS